MAKKPTKATEEGDGEAGAKKGLLGNKMVLIGGGAVVALLVLGGGAFFLLGGSGDPTSEALAVAKSEKQAFYYDLPVMIVNLSVADNRTAFVKIEVALEFSDQSMLEIIQPNLPRVLDAFQTYMRELRASDLSGSAGLYRLKEELQRRVNIAVYPARVDDVLFKNIIVQ